MSTKNAYRQKIESELELVEARFAEFKARGKGLAADARIKHSQLVEDLEQKSAATKKKLKALGEASDDTWEELKDGVESTWAKLQAALKDTVTMFEKDV
ncbi:MAG: hypothetical protein KKB91_11715 [Proteobacteria bacterium]|jgi:hypothetical protein|nr:hypothetical protein [Desulfocapsa sp.]MBU3944931.1 hypothetical protein [Pseudomonadota bacterium]MCG2743543.1 hypothetical protein [Desulfobacteraceae bacterium]MBU3982647.1 hypothetical protein [Pseudomonadota bacterium]MBU4027365.1 hypothetical protein [Pseudomonadota bacterium]